MTERHINIPIFIQHMGCPYRCVFCDQNAITNAERFSIDLVKENIEKSLSTISNSRVEIAYFGGSFTGIKRELMVSLLDLAQSYVNDGKISGIRFSTRPDYINEEIVSILKNYTINEVELGIQSVSNIVLDKSKRGHNRESIINCFNLLKSNNINFGGQMMIGLPGSSVETEIETAKLICEYGAVSTRIYPCIVFKGTELENMLNNGLYEPLQLEDAVYRAAEVLKLFNSYKVNCLRVGLQDNPNLHNKSFVSGPNNPSFGELVKSKLYFDILNKIDNSEISGKDVIIECSPGEVSAVSGYQKHNKLYLMEKRSAKSVKILENKHVERYNIILR